MGAIIRDQNFASPVFATGGGFDYQALDVAIPMPDGNRTSPGWSYLPISSNTVGALQNPFDAGSLPDSFNPTAPGDPNAPDTQNATAGPFFVATNGEPMTGLLIMLAAGAMIWYLLRR